MRNIHKATITAAIVAAGIATYNYTAPATYTLDRVIDGDTISINGGTHVRLAGIDAPELDQTCNRLTDNNPYHCGYISAVYLSSMFKSGSVLKCDSKGTDDYTRTVATCTIDGHDIGKSLVSAGQALDWPQYSHGAYKTDQDYAQSHKLGIWSSSFVPPWEWRKYHK